MTPESLREHIKIRRAGGLRKNLLQIKQRLPLGLGRGSQTLNSHGARVLTSTVISRKSPTYESIIWKMWSLVGESF